MTDATKTNLKQVLAILVGLAVVGFGFVYLYDVTKVGAWVLFVLVLLAALGVIFGNPFASKPTPLTTPILSTPLESDTTKSTTLTVTGVDQVPSSGLVVTPTQSTTSTEI